MNAHKCCRTGTPQRHAEENMGGGCRKDEEFLVCSAAFLKDMFGSFFGLIFFCDISSNESSHNTSRKLAQASACLPYHNAVLLLRVPINTHNKWWVQTSPQASISARGSE